MTSCMITKELNEMADRRVKPCSVVLDTRQVENYMKKKRKLEPLFEIQKVLKTEDCNELTLPEFVIVDQEFSPQAKRPYLDPLDDWYLHQDCTSRQESDDGVDIPSENVTNKEWVQSEVEDDITCFSDFEIFSASPQLVQEKNIFNNVQNIQPSVSVQSISVSNTSVVNFRQFCPTTSTSNNFHPVKSRTEPKLAIDLPKTIILPNGSRRAHVLHIRPITVLPMQLETLPVTPSTRICLVDYTTDSELDITTRKKNIAFNSEKSADDEGESTNCNLPSKIHPSYGYVHCPNEAAITNDKEHQEKLECILREWVSSKNAEVTEKEEEGEDVAADELTKVGDEPQEELQEESQKEDIEIHKVDAVDNINKNKTWEEAFKINKQLRELGKSYNGSKTENGIKVPNKKQEKTMRPWCTRESCKNSKKRFCNIFDETDRQQNFKEFWSKTWEDKKVMVRSLTVKVKPACTRNVKGGPPHSASLRYHLYKTDGNRYPVCKVMFCNTLSTSKETVQSWVMQRKRKSTKKIASDNLKSRKARKLSNLQLQFKARRLALEAFLDELHDCRASSSGERPFRSIRQVFRLYTEKNENTLCFKIFLEIFKNKKLHYSVLL